MYHYNAKQEKRWAEYAFCLWSKEKKDMHCWKSNIEDAIEKYGEESEQYLAAINAPSTCLLPDEHTGPHEFIIDAEIVINFSAMNRIT